MTSASVFVSQGPPVPKAVAVIPVYNHGGTLRGVVERALAFLPVIVVDDGSTDGGADALAELGATVVRHAANKGKGAAILAGANAARLLGATHIITLDADAQHYPEDIPQFMNAIAAEPYAFIVGARDFNTANVPASSRFGRRFSSFWMAVQTGSRVSDMQSGFRAYPLAALACLSLGETRYSFEIEVLVRAAWAGFKIQEIPVRVLYQPQGERISHFRALQDNLRITLLNTRLTVRALIPVPFCLHVLEEERISLLSPCPSMRQLLRQASPGRLALSAGVSMAVCTLPLLGLQSIILLACINWLRLERLCSLAVIPLSWPPLVPGLCVAAGYRAVHGHWLTEFSLRTLGTEAPQRLLEWMLGSFLLAPALGVLLGALSWLFARVLARQIPAERGL